MSAHGYGGTCCRNRRTFGKPGKNGRQRKDPNNKPHLMANYLCAIIMTIPREHNTDKPVVATAQAETACTCGTKQEQGSGTRNNTIVQCAMNCSPRPATAQVTNNVNNDDAGKLMISPCGMNSVAMLSGKPTTPPKK